MGLGTSRALWRAPKGGFSAPARRTSASTAVPPRAGFGAVATGWHATSATSTIPPTRSRRTDLLRMSRPPAVAQRAEQQRDREHPRAPLHPALPPPSRAATAPPPST